MRERRWLLPTLYGLLLALAVSDALKAARPKFKIATSSTTSTTTEEPAAAESADDEVEATTTAAETNGTTGHTLTGIPQIDYIWDPNLPRELNGYNLSEYPFYESMPKDIDFKCDGLHDGFYASVPHKCQVYHHCLFGTRYDFLCANFTAFDQKTFICHFVSEVDCANSKKYWHRNDALYQAATTTTPSTTTTSTTTTTQSNVEKNDRPPARDRDRDRDVMPRRRRPPPRRPAYDYYDEDYYEDDYERTRPRGYNRRDYDDYEDRKYRSRDRERDRDYRHRDFRDRERDRFPMKAAGGRREPARGARDPIDDEPPRARVKDQDSSRTRDMEERVRDGDERRYSDKRFRDEYDDKEPESSNNGSNEGLIKPAAPPASVYARPRPPPKLRRPVPLSEKDKYSFSTSTTARSSIDEPRRRPAAADEEEEPHRRPAAVDAQEEPRRRPAAVDGQEEPRRRPAAVDGQEEPRRRPAAPLLPADVDVIEEPRRRPAVIDSLEETVQPRRRPVEILDDEDYYEDEMEEVRPRWQMRGRPLRERDFPDKRYRDRPYRMRYRDEEEEVVPQRPRKSQQQHGERSRDRFYERERSRDRSLDRPKLDRDRDRPSVYRDRESERPRAPFRSSSPSKEPAEVAELPKRATTSTTTTTERQLPITTTTSTTTTTTTTTEEPERDTLTPQTEERQQHKFNFQKMDQQNKYHRPQEATTEKELQPVKFWKPTQRPEREREETIEDYPSDYYDDVEEPAVVPVPPPRPSVRVVKRPFLPSRGGNPNPRGLSPVGSKAMTSPRREENPIKHYIKLQTTTAPAYSNEDEEKENYQNKNYNYDNNKHNYNTYKANNNYNPQQPEYVPKQQQQQQQPINENYDVPATRTELRRPEPEFPKRRPDGQDVPKPVTSWTTDYVIPQQNNQNNNQEEPHRGNVRHQQQQNDNSNLYSSSYKTDDPQDQLSINGNFKIKQKINEVTHRNLQDIPESEYDVTLNEALTPNLSQEPSLPSGFVLPLHRQLGRDAILQPSENTYKFSRPLNQQQHEQQKQQQQQQQQHQQQQAAYAANSQFAPQSSPIARSSDRGKTVYFRTPETIQIGGNQYRQQRGHWNDYSGF